MPGLCGPQASQISHQHFKTELLLVPLPHLSSKAGGGTRMSLEPPAGRAPAVPVAVPSAWPRSPSSPSAASTRSRPRAPSRSRATARATSNDDTCACTRAQRCTRKRDAAAEPRPAARTPAARQRRLCCSIAFARSVPAPRCVAGAQRYLHACERATYPRDVRDERRAAGASARGVRGGVGLVWTEERTRRDAPRSP